MIVHVISVFLPLFLHHLLTNVLPILFDTVRSISSLSVSLVFIESKERKNKLRETVEGIKNKVSEKLDFPFCTLLFDCLVCLSVLFFLSFSYSISVSLLLDVSWCFSRNSYHFICFSCRLSWFCSLPLRLVSRPLCIHVSSSIPFIDPLVTRISRRFTRLFRFFLPLVFPLFMHRVIRLSSILFSWRMLLVTQLFSLWVTDGLFSSSSSSLGHLFLFDNNQLPNIARSASEDVCGTDQKSKGDVDEYPSPKDKDKDEGKIHVKACSLTLCVCGTHSLVTSWSLSSVDIIKVFDGNASMRKRTFRTIAVSRSATKDQLIAAALRSFHIHDDPRYYLLTDVYGKCLLTESEAFIILMNDSHLHLINLQQQTQMTSAKSMISCQSRVWLEKKERDQGSWWGFVLRIQMKEP